MSENHEDTVDLSSLLTALPDEKEKPKHIPRPDRPPLDLRVVAIASVFAGVIALASGVLFSAARSSDTIVVTVPVIMTAAPNILLPEPTPRIRNWEGLYQVNQTYGTISAGTGVKIKGTWFDRATGIRWYSVETDWGMPADIPEEAFFGRMMATPTAQYEDWTQTYILIADVGDLPAGTAVNIGSTWYDEANAIRWYQVYTADNRFADVKQDQLQPSAYPAFGATPTAIFATWVGQLKLVEQVENVPAGTLVTVGGATWYDGTTRWYTAMTAEGVTIDVREYQLAVP